MGSQVSAFVVVALLCAPSGGARADDAITARSGALEAEFGGGSITRLAVHGEPLVAPGGGGGLSGIVLALGFADAGERRGPAATIDPGGQTQRDFAPTIGGHEAHLVETVAADRDGLTVRLDAQWSRGGLAGVQWAIDAVHLDEITVVPNDDLGRIDGASMREGNPSLLRELREALPSAALGGEEVTDMAAPYLAFAQNAAWGVSPALRTWSPGLIASVDPIEARLFGARVLSYAHPTCIEPTTDPPYSACVEVARRPAALPTVRLDATALRNPNPGLAAFFRAAAGDVGPSLETPAQDPNLVLRVVDALRDADSGTIPDEGAGVTVRGPLWPGDDGAEFYPSDDIVVAHPPCRAARHDPSTGGTRRDGTGRTYASIEVPIPDVARRVMFRATVAVDPGAVGPGKTDGVAFEVAATGDGEPSISTCAYNDDAKPVALELDLTGFHGKSVHLRISVDPGPKRNPSYEWARWFSQRVEIVPDSSAR